MTHPIIEKLLSDQTKTCDEILTLLKRYKRVFREEHGITKLALFGSALSGETQRNEPVKILVRFKEPPTFMGFFGAKQRLEEILECPVHLFTKANLRRESRDMCLEEAVYA